MKNFAAFDDAVPLMFGGAPAFLTRDGEEACKELQKAAREPEFFEQASRLIKARREFSDRMGVDYHSRVMPGLLVAAVSNSTPGLFWTLANLLQDEAAYKACRDQVDSVLLKGKANAFTREELDQLTVLHSAFLESLRLHQTQFIVREVVDDFVLSPKEKGGQKYVIQKGTRIMSYANYAHYDPDIFEDPEEFKFDRFIDPLARSKKGILLTTHLRVFGGGSHMCPGRKLIGYEARALLAMMFQNFDMQWQKGEKRPEIDFAKQGVGMARPNCDPIVELRLRSSS
jgi:cytochrome P450